MEAHDAAVATVSSRVHEFYESKKPFRIYHGSTNSTRPSQYRRDNIVDTSQLNHVIKVNIKEKTVLTEPNVPMDALVAATLKHNLIPPVVMEFPGITAGGGFSGTSGESSSFRYGFFDRTVNWIELVLANGEKTRCSRKDKPDLFWGTASSFGTLAVVTLLEIQLVDAKQYVELTYYRCNSMEEAIKQMQICTDDKTVDYLDGVVLAKDWYAVCAGRLSNEVPKNAKVQRFTRARDPWFYLQAKKNTKNSLHPVMEAVPVVDYVFRYDRGGFWVGRYAFMYFFAPFIWFFRWLLDWFMHTRVLYHALHQAGLSKENIIQDVAVPYECAIEFVEWLDRHFGHYPLWICPLLMRGKLADSPYGLVAHKVNPSVKFPEYLMNFGVWGPGPSDRLSFLALNRALEWKVNELQGKKWLYAHAYYTEQEFWNIYDRPKYDALREQYHASHLPNIYHKVHVNLFAKEPREPGFKGWVKRTNVIRGYYGIYKAIRGGDYLLPKKTYKEAST